MKNEMHKRQSARLLFDEMICRINYCSICTRSLFERRLKQIGLVGLASITLSRCRTCIVQRSVSSLPRSLPDTSSFETHQEKTLRSSTTRILERHITSHHSEVCDASAFSIFRTFSASMPCAPDFTYLINDRCSKSIFFEQFLTARTRSTINSSIHQSINRFESLNCQRRGKTSLNVLLDLNMEEKGKYVWKIFDIKQRRCEKFIAFLFITD